VTTSIVFTFIGADKPGLVEKLTSIVSQHGGNWLESRMSQLAGQFAGITQVQVSNAKVDELRQALNDMSGSDLTVVVQPGMIHTQDQKIKHLELSLIGNDRPGILKELSSALAARNINVCELSTRVTSAAMTAEPLFEAVADIQVPNSQDLEELSDTLDEIANLLSVDISLDY
jgi:glycine cleavage system regulatory protein